MLLGVNSHPPCGRYWRPQHRHSPSTNASQPDNNRRAPASVANSHVLIRHLSLDTGDNLRFSSRPDRPGRERCAARQTTAEDRPHAGQHGSSTQVPLTYVSSTIIDYPRQQRPQKQFTPPAMHDARRNRQSATLRSPMLVIIVSTPTARLIGAARVLPPALLSPAGRAIGLWLTPRFCSTATRGTSPGASRA